MSEKPKQRPIRAVKEAAIKAIDSIFKPGTKRRSAPTDEPSGRAQKTRKLDPYRTPSTPIGAGADQISPVSRCSASHSSLTKSRIIYRAKMERQIFVEACGVTRKNIPWDQFGSIYLCNFSVTAQPELTIDSVKQIGKGSWEEPVFRGRLSRVLHNKVCCSGTLSYVSQSDLLDRFSTISSSSTTALKHYATSTRARRCLPNLILFSMLLTSLQIGQTWSFYWNIPGAPKG